MYIANATMSDVQIKITTFSTLNLFMFSKQTVVFRGEKPFGELQTLKLEGNITDD